MNFFLDENIPKKAAIILKESGHTVFDIRGTSKEGIPDSEILRMAKNEKAILLTTDKDFFHTLHFFRAPTLRSDSNSAP
jgi:predicted nuclease of predicted toxin-antitoxin system